MIARTTAPPPPVRAATLPVPSRLALLLSGGLLAAALATAPLPAAAAGAPRPPPATSFSRTPATDSRREPTGSLTPDGRIRACPGSIPNCVSTSATSDLYRPALATPDDPATAAAALDAAVARVCPGAVALSTSDPAAPPGSAFRAYRVPRPTDPKASLSAGGADSDVLEVLIKPAGSGGDGSIVLFRSVAGGATYVFPFQTPVLDSVQGDRVRALFREAGGLGWRPIGCDLLECFK
jgi:hypothetical protein